MKHGRWLICVMVLAGATPVTAQDARVVFEDRIGAEIKPQWSANRLTVSTTPVGEQKYLGPFGGESVLLNLTDLPEHQVVRVSVDVLIMRSWDGNAPVEGPDIFYVFGDDGRLLHATSFSWYNAQAFPGFFSVHTAPQGTGAVIRDKFGFIHEGGPRDGIFHLEFAVPHRVAKLGLRFVATTQSAISDEAWGITGVRVTVEEAKRLDAGALAAAWEGLGSTDPAASARAVWELACSGEPAVAMLAERLKGAILPAAVELLDPFRAHTRPKAAGAADGFAIADAGERRAVLGAHVLQLIGGESALAARRGMVTRPLVNTKAARIVVRDSTTRAPIPFVPIWTYVYSAALHASALTDAQGVATFDIPSQGITNILFQNARAVYVPVGIRTTYAALGVNVGLEMPIERAVPVGGTVVDDQQKPVEGATVVITMTQRVTAPVIARLGSMSSVTDKAGRWTMDLGPEKPDGLQIAIRPPLADSSVPVTSTGYLQKLKELQDQTLTLIAPRPTIVRGKVIDADTGQPVQKFQLSFARMSAAGPSAWQPVNSGLRPGGFELPVPPTYEAIIIRIEADGYLTTNSELIPGGGGPKELEMKLFSPR